MVLRRLFLTLGLGAKWSFHDPELNVFNSLGGLCFPSAFNEDGRQVGPCWGQGTWHPIPSSATQQGPQGVSCEGIRTSPSEGQSVPVMLVAHCGWLLVSHMMPQWVCVQLT